MFILVALICVLIPSSIAYLISDNSLLINDLPVIYYCIAISYLIHWIVFIPSYLQKTEKFYDFTGMIAYLSIIGFALYQKKQILGSIDFDSMLVGILISVWTLRLGMFLFYRVFKVGEDDRFEAVKTSASRFFIWFTVSGLWVSLTSIAAMNILTTKIEHNNYYFVYLGALVWLFGFLFEVISDYQKMKFKNIPDNKNKFIDTGLWSLSRHPNYFGEIILWIGIFIITLPSISGNDYITIISPIFVYFLLNKISGINLLEIKAQKRWGELESYKEYRSKTPQLIPKFWN
jgi:steroid 5-alpha reductase family enzyme